MSGVGCAARDGGFEVHRVKVGQSTMKLIDYFERICIIHLPDRIDRIHALERELRPLGIDINGPKVQVPYAPRPADASGYASKGVYGNFLSHYEILKQAMHDQVQSVWILEDDAIFSCRMAREQEQTADFLSRTSWDICYLGHSLYLKNELQGRQRGLVRFSGPFYLAHCYAVHARALPSLVSYLEETMSNPRGHPRGAQVYIDAAHTLFRQLNPDIISLVANPVLSIQKGSPSNLGGGHWYDRNRITRPLVGLARAARDECWRRTEWTP